MSITWLAKSPRLTKMILTPTFGNPTALRNQLSGIALCWKLLSWAHRAVQTSCITHSDKSVAGMRAVCIKILLLLHAAFPFLLFSLSTSKLRTGHQMWQMAGPCPPAVSLLSARCPPWPHCGLLPSPMMCWSGGSVVLLNRRAVVTGVQADPLQPCGSRLHLRVWDVWF